MIGYNLPGIKLLNRIYKTENRINGGLGVMFFYNNYLVNNRKKFSEPIQNSWLEENIGIAGILGTIINLMFSVAINQQPVSVA